MGSFLAKTPAHVRRAKRLVRFCKEIKRALLNLCVDHNVPIHSVDFFVEDLYLKMEYHALEYPLETLLEMLLNDGYIKQTFERYRERI